MREIRPCGSEGSCEKIENRLHPALSVRRSARATQVERALRARFHLWTRRRDGSGWLNSFFSQLQGGGTAALPPPIPNVEPGCLNTKFRIWDRWHGEAPAEPLCSENPGRAARSLIFSLTLRGSKNRADKSVTDAAWLLTRLREHTWMPKNRSVPQNGSQGSLRRRTEEVHTSSSHK